MNKLIHINVQQLFLCILTVVTISLVPVFASDYEYEKNEYEKSEVDEHERDKDDEHERDEDDEHERDINDSDNNNVNSNHANLTYSGPDMCLECHEQQAHDLFDTTHYQWGGYANYMLNRPDLLQGKISGAVNTYCGNILGNEKACMSCHIGRGALPEQNVSQAQLENIDCLVCHQKDYKRKKVNGVMVPDLDNMSISMDEAVQAVHKPNRSNCLSCHAKAGGGDAVKRGDLALATANTHDFHYDVHMSKTGADLNCQDCHTTQHHHIAGKGSDIRPTDLDVPVDCANSGCHSSTPHDSKSLNRHLTKVACQTCHIPVFGKNASDSIADEATEMHRSWQSGSEHELAPKHPVLTKANNVIPRYKFWNRYSDNYLLGDVIHPDAVTGIYSTSKPDGSIDDPNSKLYPFKYKTSDYPLHEASSRLIAMDTSVFFATADADAAALSGLQNMIEQGMDASDSDTIKWVTTDTYQLLNHQVSPSDDALACTQCHLNTSRMNLQQELGYAPENANPNTCADGCHSGKKASEWKFGSFSDFKEGHKKHNEKNISCSKCH
ncbi:MAG: hypothetical protein HQL46_15470 [Gammaproteobacteria bacterium]|nr:hypothetical protein [Gammaproteobacteria bacterium]